MKQSYRKYALGASVIGAVIAVWRILRHLSIPLQTSEIDLEFTTATPHLLDKSIFQGERLPQFLQDGVGPLFHRRYYVDIADVAMSKEELMTEIQSHLNSFSALDMAFFEKTEHSDSSEMKVGDDFFVHIVGPWNGPVRVINVSPTSFSFITLEKHLEVGEIQFRLIDHPDRDDVIRFEIRSWTRSQNWFVNLLYDRIPLTKISQTRMWVYFCQRVVEVSKGEALDEVHVMTHRVPYRQFQFDRPHQLERWQQYRPQIEFYRQAQLNFDLDKREEFIEAGGWNIDSYEIDLPQEAPGEPEKEGSWEQAKRVLLNYEFPDPDLITGIFIPDDVLKERIMLLEAHFLIFTFRFGVRIGGVIDEEREDAEKGRARVWGYSYQTLEGHFEMGEITFEIWKFLDTGRVEFRMHSYSKTGYIRNPFYRIGFAIFGRRLQRRFADTALERMERLVISRLTKSAETVEKPDVQRISEADLKEQIE